MTTVIDLLRFEDGCSDQFEVPEMENVKLVKKKESPFYMQSGELLYLDHGTTLFNSDAPFLIYYLKTFPSQNRFFTCAQPL